MKYLLQLAITAEVEASDSESAMDLVEKNKGLLGRRAAILKDVNTGIGRVVILKSIRFEKPLPG